MLGHFLRDELNIEQVDLQLSAGSLKLNSLNLNPDALNHELLNAIVSSSTNADIRSTPVPFRIENCSVDDFSVSFSSLARILEDGCSVDVSGIVLDLIPGSTLTHQLLEIAKDRAIKLAAKRLEQKAKDAEEASRAASNIARRAAAIAAGLSVPPEDDDRQQKTTEQVPTDQDDGDVYTTYDDALAEESATFLTALLEQVFSNIQIQGENIRIRFRLEKTCQEGEKDQFLEIHVPKITYREENKRKVVKFSSISISWIHDRIQYGESTESTDQEENKENNKEVNKDGEEITMMSIGKSGEEGLPHRIVLSQGDGGPQNVLIDVYCARTRIRLPSDPSIIFNVMHIVDKFTPSGDSGNGGNGNGNGNGNGDEANGDEANGNEANGSENIGGSGNGSSGDDVKHANVVVNEVIEDVLSSDDEYGDVNNGSDGGETLGETLLGNTMTASQVFDLGMGVASRVNVQNENRNMSSSEEENDDNNEDDDDEDEFEDCLGPPTTKTIGLKEQELKKQRINTTSSTSTASISTRISIVISDLIVSYVDAKVQPVIPNYTRRIQLRVPHCSIGIDVSSRASATTTTTVRCSSPSIETCLTSTLIDGGGTAERTLLSLESFKERNRHIPQVLTITHAASGMVGVAPTLCISIEEETVIHINVGIDTLLRWSMSLTNWNEKLQHLQQLQQLQQLPLFSPSNSAPIAISANVSAAASNIAPPLSISFNILGQLRLRLVPADDITDLSHSFCWERPLCIHLKTLRVRIKSGTQSSTSVLPSRKMFGYATPTDFPCGILITFAQCSVAVGDPKDSSRHDPNDRAWLLNIHDDNLREAWIHILTRNNNENENDTTQLVHPGIHPMPNDSTVHSSNGHNGDGIESSFEPGSPGRMFRVTEEPPEENNNTNNTNTNGTTTGNNTNDKKTNKLLCVRAENHLLALAETSIVVSLPNVVLSLHERTYADALDTLDTFFKISSRENDTTSKEDIQKEKDEDEESNDSDYEDEDEDEDGNEEHLAGLLSESNGLLSFLCSVPSAFAIKVRSLTLNMVEDDTMPCTNNKSVQKDNQKGASKKEDKEKAEDLNEHETAEDARTRAYYQGILHLRSLQEQPFTYNLESSHFQIFSGSWTRKKTTVTENETKENRIKKSNSKGPQRVRDYLRVSCADLVLTEGPTSWSTDRWTPVLYSIKWGGPDKPSRLPPFGDCLHGCNVWITQMGTTTTTVSSLKNQNISTDTSLEIDMYGMTVRYDVNSTWLFRLIPLMLEPKGTNKNNDNDNNGNNGNNGNKQEQKEDDDDIDTITELRLSVHDSVIDYVPTQKIPMETAGRLIFVLREITVSTNIMRHAMESIIAIQIRDASIRMAGRKTPYALNEAQCEHYEREGKVDGDGLEHMRLNVWDLLQILDDSKFAMLGRLDTMDVTITSRPTLAPYEQLKRNRNRKSGVLGETPPAPTDIVIDGGTFGVTCCADSCAALLDVIIAWQDEFALSDSWLRARAEYIPQRSLPIPIPAPSTEENTDASNGNNGNMEQESEMKSVLPVTLSSMAFHRPPAPEVDAPPFVPSVLTSIDHHAFSGGGSLLELDHASSSLSSPRIGVTTSSSRVSNTRENDNSFMDTGGTGGTVGGGPVIIENFYQPTQTTNNNFYGVELDEGEQPTARWLDDEPLLLDTFKGADVEETMDDFLNASAASLSMENNNENESQRGEVKNGNDNESKTNAVPVVSDQNLAIGMSSSSEEEDDGADGEGDGTATMYESTLGFDGWWNSAGNNTKNNKSGEMEEMTMSVYSKGKNKSNPKNLKNNALLVEEDNMNDGNDLTASVMFHRAEVVPTAPPMDGSDGNISMTSDSEFAAQLGYSHCADALREDSDEDLNASMTGSTRSVLYADIEFGTTYVDGENETKQESGRHDLSKSVTLALPSAPPPDDWEDELDSDDEDDGDYDLNGNLDSDSDSNVDSDSDSECDSDLDNRSISNRSENYNHSSMDDVDLFQRSDAEDEEEIVQHQQHQQQEQQQQEQQQQEQQATHLHPLNSKTATKAGETKDSKYHSSPQVVEEVPTPTHAGKWYDSNPSDRVVYRHHIPEPIDGLGSASGRNGNMTHHMERYEESLFSVTPNDGKPRPQPVESRVLLRNMDVRMKIYGGRDFPTRSDVIRRRASRATKEEGRYKSDVVFNGQQAKRADRTLLLGALLEENHGSIGTCHPPNETKHENQTETLRSEIGPQWWGERTTNVTRVTNGKGKKSNSNSSNSNSNTTNNRKQRSQRNVDETVELHLKSICVQNSTYLLPKEVKNGTLNVHHGNPNENSNGTGLDDEQARIMSSLKVVVEDIEMNDLVRASGVDKMVSHWKSDRLHPRETGSGMLVLEMHVKTDDDVTQRSISEEDGTFTGALESGLSIAMLPIRFHVDQDTAAMLIRFGMGVAELSDHRSKEEEDQRTEVLSERQQYQQSIDVIFFRTFSLSEVRAKIDYVSKRTNLSGLREGNLIELLNVVPLENMKLIFPKVDRVALCGPAVVGEEIAECWIEALVRTFNFVQS